MGMLKYVGVNGDAFAENVWLDVCELGGDIPCDVGACVHQEVPLLPVVEHEFGYLPHQPVLVCVGELLHAKNMPKPFEPA